MKFHSPNQWDDEVSAWREWCEANPPRTKPGDVVRARGQDWRVTDVASDPLHGHCWRVTAAPKDRGTFTMVLSERELEISKPESA
jgi:hypothetical protein